MSTEVKKKSSMYLIHASIYLVLTIGIGLLPTFGQVTEYGMDILGIFIGLIYGWTFIGFVWPSIFGLVALGYTAFSTDVLTAVAMGFSDTLVWMVFFMMIFAEILRRTGVTEYMGYWILSRKICNGKPWFLIFTLFSVAFICGGIVSMYGTLFMLWAIVYELFNIAGYEKRSLRCAFILAGILYMCAMSCMIFPFKPYPSVVLGLCANAGATTLPFVPWLIIGMITAFGMILLYMAVGKFVFKLDYSKFSELGDVFSEYRSRKMSSENKLGMMLLAVFIIILVLIAVMPSGISIIGFLKKADMVGMALILICIAILYRKKDGSNLVTFAELTHAVSWDIILMFAVTLPVCGAMGSEETGIMTTIMSALTPLLSHLSPTMFVIASVVVLGFITQVAHNLVLTMTFTPLLATVAANYGIDPLLFGFLLVTMLQCATATPAASAQGALVFANSEWIATKDAYKLGFTFAIIAMIVLICLVYPVGIVLF